MRLLLALALLVPFAGCDRGGRDPEPQPIPSPVQPTPTSDVALAPEHQRPVA